VLDATSDGTRDGRRLDEDSAHAARGDARFIGGSGLRLQTHGPGAASSGCFAGTCSHPGYDDGSGALQDAGMVSRVAGRSVRSTEAHDRLVALTIIFRMRSRTCFSYSGVCGSTDTNRSPPRVVRSVT